jgi:hypothetical protein
MRFGVVLGGFTGMMICLQTVAMRDVGMVAGQMMFALVVMLGGLAMVLSGLLVMFGSGLMVLGFVQSAHYRSPQRMRLCRAASVPGPDAGTVTHARQINELS